MLRDGRTPVRVDTGMGGSAAAAIQGNFLDGVLKARGH